MHKDIFGGDSILFRKVSGEIETLIEHHHENIHKRYRGGRCGDYYEIVFNALLSNLQETMALIFTNEQDVSINIKNLQGFKECVAKAVDGAFKYSHEAPSKNPSVLSKMN